MIHFTKGKSKFVRKCHFTFLRNEHFYSYSAITDSPHCTTTVWFFCQPRHNKTRMTSQIKATRPQELYTEKSPFRLTTCWDKVNKDQIRWNLTCQARAKNSLNRHFLHTKCECTISTNIFFSVTNWNWTTTVGLSCHLISCYKSLFVHRACLHVS